MNLEVAGDITNQGGNFHENHYYINDTTAGGLKELNLGIAVVETKKMLAQADKPRGAGKEAQEGSAQGGKCGT